MSDENRPIEMYRLTDGGDTGTWDTVVVEIPADTDPDKIEEVARIHAEAQYGPGAYMLYSSMDDECPETEVPARSEIPVVLSFDLNEVTSGSEIQQQVAAIEFVNLVLQREPFGLGAGIWMMEKCSGCRQPLISASIAAGRCVCCGKMILPRENSP